MMTNHQHIQMFFHCIDGIGARGIGRGGQYVWLTADFDNIRGMTATRAFGVIGVNGATLEGSNRIIHKPGFIQGIRVNGNLYIKFIGNRERTINRGGRSSPVFVQF